MPTSNDGATSSADAGPAHQGGSGGSGVWGAGGGPSAGGGPPTGGAATDGGGTGGSGATACALPGSFRWTSTGPLVAPKSPLGHDFVSIKDPTVVLHEGKYHVFATVYDRAPGATGWRSVYLSFTDFDQADAAPQTYMGSWSTGSTVAPEVFYFRPQNRWYLIFQWGARYSTNDDITNPNGWTAPKPLLAGEPKGALDYFPICDDSSCYLFFSADDGKLYRSKTSIQSFPAFSGYEVVMSDPDPGKLFEASSVYRVQGRNEYLLLVEAYGPRYFRSFTAPTLDGPWTPLADSQAAPFAGEANVSFPGAPWTRDISHGELVRVGSDETQTIDPCHLRLFYQGVDPTAKVPDYALLPYRLGLLTATP